MTTQQADTAGRETGAVAVSRGKLTGLEIGRGLAAVAVVVFHANGVAMAHGHPHIAWLTLLEHGVDFFFVLSGYIILHAHAADIGQDGALARYWRKRAIRLVPTLWIMVLAYATLKLFWGTPPTADLVLRSLFPYPSLEPALPQVVWTLRHEFLFYISFAVLIVAPRAGLALFILWGGAVVGQMIAGLSGNALTGTASMLLSSYTLDFMLGMGVAAAHRGWGVRASPWPLLFGLIALIGVLVLGAQFNLMREGQNDYASSAALFWTPVIGLCCAVIVHGLVSVEAHIPTQNWLVGTLVRLGAASYAIYLIHTITNSVLTALLGKMPALAGLVDSTLSTIVLASSIGLVAGLLFHHWIDAPLGSALSRRFARRKTTAS